MLKNIRFDLLFCGIRKLHPSMRKKFYPIVLKRIMRSGDHNARLKIVLANEAGNAWCRYNPGKSNRRSRLREPRGKKRGNVRTGFASIHPDKDMSGTVFALEIGAQRTSRGIQRGVIQRRCARDAANSIGPEEFFSHQGRTGLFQA